MSFRRKREQDDLDPHKDGQQDYHEAKHSQEGQDLEPRWNYEAVKKSISYLNTCQPQIDSRFYKA